MDIHWLIFAIIYGTIGLGIFIYGYNEARHVPLIAGVLLMVVPFLIGSVVWMSIFCVPVIISPILPGARK